MAKIAIRRTISSSEPTFSRPLISASRRCSTSGTTMSLDTMIDSATDSTITMAVAADRPPTKAAMVRMLEPACSGSASTNMSLSTAPAGNVNRPASAIGTTNKLISTR